MYQITEFLQNIALSRNYRFIVRINSRFLQQKAMSLNNLRLIMKILFGKCPVVLDQNNATRSVLGASYS
ncbi:MAG: hypothetical protein ACJA11_000483 [Glaciecola sp.]|jgi:hypothetical protein